MSTKNRTNVLVKPTLATALALAMSVSLLPAGVALADEGDAGETVEISTPAELSSFSERVYSGDTMKGVTVRLTQDIDMTGVNFVPIGTNNGLKDSIVAFEGTFDGQGHAIKNLTIYARAAELQSHVSNALFGGLNGATVKNLVIDSVTISANSMFASSTAIITPNAAGCTFDNITLQGTNSCGNGLVITATGSSFNNITLDYTTSSFSSAIVKNAQDNCVFSDCVANGTFTATVSKGAANAPFVGVLTNSSISNCVNNAVVTIHMNDAGYMGGIVGSAVGSSITDCKNTAMVTLTNRGMNNNYEPVGGYCGGIVGTMESTTVSRCVNYGSVFNEAVVGTREADPQEEYPAGLVGRAVKGSVIDSCANTGDVTANLMGWNKTYGNSAGLVCLLQGSTLSNSYNTGDVTAELTTHFGSGTVRLKQTMGGIARLVDDDATVTNCYSTAAMSCTYLKPSKYEYVLDAVAPECEGTLSGVYYYRGGLAAGSKVGKALTAAEMSNKASYAGFDFEKVWAMDEGEGMLPKLQFEGDVQRASSLQDVDFSTAAIAAIKSATYNGKAQTPAVAVTVDGSTLVAGTDYAVSYRNNVNAGSATVTVSGLGRYVGSASSAFAIAKAKTSMTAKAKKAKLKRNKKKAQTTAIAVAGAQGKVTFKSNKKAVKVSSKGKVTIKKGFKGTAKITVKCAGNGNYNPTTKTVTIKVK